MPNATRLLDDERWTDLESALRATAERHVPDWVDHTQHDPGVTIVQLFGFLGENLIDRAETISERARSRLAEMIVRLELSRAAEPLLGLPMASSQAEEFSGVKRVHYFFGQVLSDDDFRDQQEYLNEKRHLHNRLLHGTGVVTGLGIAMSDSSPALVSVAPGVGLDSLGREVQLAKAVEMTVTETVSPQYVVIDYVERKADLAPGPRGDVEATRIEEGARVRLVGPPAPADGIVLGRIVKRARGWEVDHSFEPRRPR